MSRFILPFYEIGYVEIFTPMAKALAYWHEQALGFEILAYADVNSGMPNISSYVLKSGDISLVLTSSYPTSKESDSTREINSFIAKNYCGVKRFALEVDSVEKCFNNSVKNGAIPTKPPIILEDDNGFVEEAAIKLYDDREVVFSNRKNYKSIFKPGYKKIKNRNFKGASLFGKVDHIAAELRINEIDYWTNYLSNSLGTELVQSIKRSKENKTGMVLNINQSVDRNLTLVMAEPDSYLQNSKIQKNIEMYGPGIHHLAFTTNDLVSTIEKLQEKNVEFVNFPPSYYSLVRENPDFKDFDIDSLKKNGILIDKEDDAFLLQKFIKPISDRPFFFYEIVQRVNGYNGFALNNINVLKKAEELQIMKTS